MLTKLFEWRWVDNWHGQQWRDVPLGRKGKGGPGRRRRGRGQTYLHAWYVLFFDSPTATHVQCSWRTITTASILLTANTQWIVLRIFFILFHLLHNANTLFLGFLNDKATTILPSPLTHLLVLRHVNHATPGCKRARWTCSNDMTTSA